MPRKNTVLEAVDVAAAHSIPEIQERFAAAIRSLREELSDETVKSAVRAGSAVPIIDSSAWGVFQAVLSEAFLPESSALAEAVIIAARRTTKIPPLKGLELDLEAIEDAAAAWMRQEGAARVVQIEKTTEQGIQRIMSDALRGPEPRRKAARRIADVKGLGLTEHQSRHLQTWINNQVAGGTWDDLSEKEIQRRISREFGRRVTNRGRLIAQTESYNAGNAAVRTTYEQAVDQGVIKGTDYVLEWVTRGGPCPRCAALAGKWCEISGGVFTSDPVASGSYRGQVLRVERPTVHPHCYCTVRTARRADVTAAVPAAIFAPSGWVEALQTWVLAGGDLPQIANDRVTSAA